MATLELRYLADVPDLLPLVARWHQLQWGYLSNAISLDERIRRYQSHLQREQPPMTFVALVDGQPAGSASLVENDLGDRSDLTPWLASVYVTPPMRRQGVGAALVHRVAEEAARLGYATLYLYTYDKARFYQHQGWRAVERRPYRGVQVTVMALDLDKLPSSHHQPSTGRSRA
ncbi:MAG TPA: GNAT family N-acetyltransferase [Caldilineaceae bacterium]|nr:GNAT family N-acetyltransferase [Caldilineaceae bacterium]